MLWPKKNSYKELDNEKKFLRLENSPPPHNFSNGPSLSCYVFNNQLLSINCLVFHFINKSPVTNFMYLVGLQ